MTPSPASSTPHHAGALPPSPPPLSALGRPRGRKKGAKEAEVRTGCAAMGAQRQALGSEICEATTCCPNSADHASGEPQAGPSGEIGPPWGPGALDPSSLGRGRRPGAGPSAASSRRIPAAEPPAPFSPLSLGAQPPPPILSALGPRNPCPPHTHTQEWIPVTSQTWGPDPQLPPLSVPGVQTPQPHPYPKV